MSTAEVYDYYIIHEESKNYPILEMDPILKSLFKLNNKRPIIDFINAVYGDNISYDAIIHYGDKEINQTPDILSGHYMRFYADMYIHVKDNGFTYDYEIEFQTVFDDNISIRLFRYGFEKAESENRLSRTKDTITIRFPEPYLILMEGSRDTPDKVNLRVEIPKQGHFTYSCNVMKYWTYDLAKLAESNMYLLYPLQVFKLRKAMEYVKNSSKPDNVKHELMNILINSYKSLAHDTVVFIDKAYLDGKLTLKDYDEMTKALENLSSYMNDKYCKYSDIEKEVKSMVKTFYDPKVEQRGVEKGKAELLLMMLKKKFNYIPEDLESSIHALHENKLDEIALEIFEINDLDDIKRFLN